MRSLILATTAALALAACGREPAPEKVEGAASVAGSPDRPAVVQAPAPTMQTENRTFRDWRVVCDNGNACVAWAGGDGGWLRVALQPGPGQVPEIGTGSWALGEIGDDSPGLNLMVDGRRQEVRAGPANAANAQDHADRMRRLVSAIAQAKTIALSSGSQTEAIPATGAAAAFLWIDERQGRLETTSALIRRGARPDSAVPAAPALPRVTPARAVDQGAFRGADNPMESEPPKVAVPASLESRTDVRECRAEGNQTLNAAILAVKLSANTELWGIPCGSGAYNATYKLFLTGLNGANPRPTALPEREPRQEGDIGGEGAWLVNPVYDPAAQTLTVFPRGRGLGDCGTITTWTWTGTAFALTEERSMGDCWGMGPDHWPTYWRTRRG